MYAKLTLFPLQGVSRSFVFREGENRLAGRDPDSDLPLEDPRVSARHALFEWNGAGWTLRDLGSKNGTFLNGVAATEIPLCGEDWISFGGLLAQFATLSEEEFRLLKSERAARLKTSAEIHRGLTADVDPRGLLRRLTESVLDVTGAERGFVLILAPDGKLRAEVAAGFAPDQPVDERFAGSFGAIRRVLETGRSVVAVDAKTDAFLGKRPSVAELGLGALACIPLLSKGSSIGVIYVDGRKRGGGFTDLDLEILEALADHAAIVIGSLNLDRQIRELFRKPPQAAARPGGPASRFLEDLAFRVEQIARGPEMEKEMQPSPQA